MNDLEDIMDDDDDDDEARRAKGEARWLTTYGDAMTLLLVFFVILLSMATIDPQTFQIVISSFQGAVGVFDSGRTMTPAKLMDMGINVKELSQAEEDVTKNIPKEVITILETEETEAKVRRDERGLVIQITNKILFAEGQVEVTDSGREFLGRVAELLEAPSLRARQVRVEGHTDNIPADRWDSNWEISVMRSSNVVEVLDGQYGIDAKRLSAVGFGSNRPIMTNETQEGRSENRRVEIVILQDDDEDN